MPLAFKKLHMPLRKLRKSLKHVSKAPSADEIHDLRTRARRMEAVFRSLSLDEDSDGQRLLQTIEPIRKKAGRVRDMDVLIGSALTLTKQHHDEAATRLLEQLGARREKSAAKLKAEIRENQRQARRLLQKSSSLIAKTFKTPSEEPQRQEWQAGARAEAIHLATELAEWPALSAQNLHSYRKKIKELQNILDFAEAPDQEIIEAFGQAKDAIGEWHDWSELTGIASKVLAEQSRCRLVHEIRSVERIKLEAALFLTLRIRNIYLAPEAGAGNRTLPMLQKRFLAAASRLATSAPTAGLNPDSQSENGSPPR